MMYNTACLQCGRETTEYEKGKWRCPRCGNTLVLTDEKLVLATPGPVLAARPSSQALQEGLIWIFVIGVFSIMVFFSFVVGYWLAH